MGNGHLITIGGIDSIQRSVETKRQKYPSTAINTISEKSQAQFLLQTTFETLIYALNHGLHGDENYQSLLNKGKQVEIFTRNVGSFAFFGAWWMLRVFADRKPGKRGISI